jgi:hypothetical protein
MPGEDLIAFRDKNGAIGLVAQRPTERRRHSGAMAHSSRVDGAVVAYSPPEALMLTIDLEQAADGRWIGSSSHFTGQVNFRMVREGERQI